MSRVRDALGTVDAHSLFNRTLGLSDIVPNAQLRLKIFAVEQCRPGLLGRYCPAAKSGSVGFLTSRPFLKELLLRK